MTTFEPRQTRDWSTRELDALTGRHVRARINDTEHAGVAVDWAIGRDGRPTIVFAGGHSVSWHRETDQATITVEPTEEN